MALQGEGSDNEFATNVDGKQTFTDKLLSYQQFRHNVGNTKLYTPSFCMAPAALTIKASADGRGNATKFKECILFSLTDLLLAVVCNGGRGVSWANLPTNWMCFCIIFDKQLTLPMKSPTPVERPLI